MIAAAEQYARMGAMEKQIAGVAGPGKAPVQSFDGGNATPGASNASAQLAYITNEGPGMDADQFEKTFGFNPE